MAERRTIVCLANSTKLGAYCVAGVEPESGRWIRPLGSGNHGAVTADEQTLPDGARPVLLDVIDLPLGRAVPQLGQPENWELAGGGWTRVDYLDEDQARKLLGSLVVDTPVFGTNERSIPVSEVEAGYVESSLAVICPQQLRWAKRVWPEGMKIRARFRHAGAWHDLPVTDPVWVSAFAHDAPGDYEHTEREEVFLVLSLGEPMNDEHWKLVAAVICLDIHSGRRQR